MGLLYIHALLHLIGASLSEPHTYEENGGFVCLYIYIYISVVRHAVYFYLPDSCGQHSVSLHTQYVHCLWCLHRQYVHCLWWLANAPVKCAKCARAAMDSTAGDSTASSLSDSRRDKEESLRRRRERDRVRRASETEAQKKERLRVRRERDRARRAARSEEQRSRVLLRKRAHFQDSVASESIEARELRLQRLSSNQRERLAAESEEERQARLQHLSANQHERLAAESEEERQARLQHLSARQHERLAAESEEERQARLQHLRANQHERLAAESEEERQARLQHLRANQHERLAAESEEERQARLQQQCLYHQERLAAECVVDREARLQADRERHRAQRSVQPQLSLFEQYSVRQKMVAFHRHLATLAISNCTTCSEGFPGLECCRTTECRRCSQDKHIPKLYSTANNMNPGVVPLQLQVCEQVLHAQAFHLYCLIPACISLSMFFIISRRDYHKWRRCLSLLSCP